MIKKISLLTIDEAAELKKCSPSSILYYIYHPNPDKRLPASKHGRDWVIDECDLDKLNINPRAKQ
jgi:hypothetical protein